MRLACSARLGSRSTNRLSQIVSRIKSMDRGSAVLLFDERFAVSRLQAIPSGNHIVLRTFPSAGGGTAKRREFLLVVGLGVFQFLHRCLATGAGFRLRKICAQLARLCLHLGSERLPLSFDVTALVEGRSLELVPAARQSRLGIDVHFFRLGAGVDALFPRAASEEPEKETSNCHCGEGRANGNDFHERTELEGYPHRGWE